MKLESNVSPPGIRIVASIVGAFLLALSVWTVSNRRTSLATRIDRQLSTTSTEEAKSIENEFETARSTVLLLSRNTALSRTAELEYASRSRTLAPAEQELASMLRKSSDDSLLYLQSLYTGRIAEACLINDLGHKLSRAVGSKLAKTKDISNNEAIASFFAPTMRSRAGEVFQAAPYLSDDTNTWVVGNSTPLPFLRSAKAFVHFELTLDSFANRLSFTLRSMEKAAEMQTIEIVDRKTGLVIANNRGVLFPNGTNPRKAGIYRWLAVTNNPTGLASHKGRRLSISESGHGTGNENDWLVVSSIPLTTSFFTGMNGLPVWLAVAGLLSLLLGLVASRLFVRYLTRAANIDPLTGLANRRRLNTKLSELKQSNQLLAILLIDLDRFKEVNDSYGHEVGDALLRSVGERIAEYLPASDFACRLGGDEFAILLRGNHQHDEFIAQAWNLHAQLLRPYTVEGLRLDLEASLGMAVACTNEVSGQELLHRADQAMFAAKQLHVGVEVFSSGHESAGQRRLALLGELRTAIECHELMVFFQPKMSFSSGNIHSMEALVRWQHPTRGLLSPSEFIEFAEQTSLIRPLTLEVIELTLCQIREWELAGNPMKVAVNISAVSLLDNQLIPGLLHLLKKHSCEASSLQFEITESTIMHDPEQALEMLTRINELGIEISIDDFGTGYSSLAYLTNLNAQELKIDRVFVSRMTSDRASASVVGSIIALGHTLGMRVVAEGVEDEETAEQLREAGCDVGQGFLWSRPVPAAQAFDLLNAPSQIKTLV